MLNFSGDTEPRSITWRNLTQFDIDRRQFNLALLPSRLSSLLLLLNLLTACSSQSSTDKLAKELQTVKSWTATAHMVADAQIHGDVPTVYAKHTLEKAQEELKHETDTLSKLSIAPSQRRTVLEQLKRLEDTLGQMSKAVEQKDPQAMIQQIQQLSTQEQTINMLAKTAGGSHE
jgi:hypothetical protein